MATRTAAATSASAVYATLLRGQELALLDVREEAAYAAGHPLFAASLPLGRLELEVLDRVPRASTEIVVYDCGEGLASRAGRTLRALGYRDVSVLDGGVEAWARDGYELFIDVNSPSKAFGEFVDATAHPPSIEPEELLARIRRSEDVVVLDARRFEEFQTMSIPGAASVPGGELVRRLASVVEHEDTLVVVNCAGRTRSIIGAQSLRNAGVRNPVVALRNGTIGWTLAGQALAHGAIERPGLPERQDGRIRWNARHLAEAAGVARVDADGLAQLLERDEATTYRFDVSDPRSYLEGHLKDFRSAPGGQLVQETDVYATVRGATIVLADSDGVGADMTASWLAQMGWRVAVLEPDAGLEHESGPWQAALPEIPEAASIGATDLARLVGHPGVLVVDLASSTEYRAGHLPSAAFALRSELADRLRELPGREQVVLTSPDGVAARFAAAELAESGVRVLEGGMSEWRRLGLGIEREAQRWLSPPIDRYRRPYEGTDVDEETMRAYLEWEYGLVEQLERDHSHGFFVLRTLS